MYVWCFPRIREFRGVIQKMTADIERMNYIQSDVSINRIHSMNTTPAKKEVLFYFHKKPLAFTQELRHEGSQAWDITLNTFKCISEYLDPSWYQCCTTWCTAHIEVEYFLKWKYIFRWGQFQSETYIFLRILKFLSFLLRTDSSFLPFVIGGAKFVQATSLGVLLPLQWGPVRSLWIPVVTTM